jgi:hypothetical protein
VAVRITTRRLKLNEAGSTNPLWWTRIAPERPASAPLAANNAAIPTQADALVSCHQ